MEHENQEEGRLRPVVIIHPYDPAASYASGIRSAITGFIRAAPPELSIRVVGCTTDRRRHPVGRAARVQVGPRAIEFLPILAGHPSTRAAIPISLRFTLRLFLWRRRLNLDGAHLVFHRPECPWPLAALPNPKLLFLHYAVYDQVFHAPSAGKWLRIPGLYLWLERRVLRRMDQVRCPRMDGVRWWRERYPDLAQRIQFLPCYVDETIFHIFPEAERRKARAELLPAQGLDPEMRHALYVGRFDRQKDPMLLLRAWRILLDETPDAGLIVAGEGRLEEQMRLFVADHGMGDRIRFVGTLAEHEVARWMNVADALVLSSATEGMSISMLEALRCGLPVVAPDLGETGRIVNNDAVGRLTRTHEPRDLVRAIHEVLHLPRDRQACAACAEPYTPTRVLEPIFSWILAGGDSAPDAKF